jgi:hypothetical protein
MTHFFLDLGKPTMKSIKISHQIVGGIRRGWSVLRDDNFSLVALKNLIFNHKGVGTLFHTRLEKIMFDPFIGFSKP